MVGTEVFSDTQEFRSQLGAEARTVTLKSNSANLDPAQEGLEPPVLSFQRIDLNPGSKLKPGFVLEYDSEHNIFLLTGDKTGKSKLDPESLVDRMSLIKTKIASMYEENPQLPQATILVDIYDNVTGLPDAMGIMSHAQKIQQVLPELSHVHAMYETTANETMSAINNSIFGMLKRLTEGSRLLTTRKHPSAVQGLDWILKQGFLSSGRAKFKQITTAPEGLYSSDQRNIANNALKEMFTGIYNEDKTVLLLNQALQQLKIAG